MMMAGDRFETRPVMLLAGDDDTAKSTVAQLVGELGFEALDAGALKQARNPRTIRDGMDQPSTLSWPWTELGLRCDPSEGRCVGSRAGAAAAGSDGSLDN